MITIVEHKSLKGRWVLQDEKGRIHSNPIADKDRAQRQADHMNAQFARMPGALANSDDPFDLPVDGNR